ncbi:hypothetical protein BDZ97DRAFT_1757031 [Flammula alnicola]|nr:hypothetical protein BDZ97DRAFT_1757031 [Flammula alnicola]
MEGILHENLGRLIEEYVSTLVNRTSIPPSLWSSFTFETIESWVLNDHMFSSARSGALNGGFEDSGFVPNNGSTYKEGNSKLKNFIAVTLRNTKPLLHIVPNTFAFQKQFPLDFFCCIITRKSSADEYPLYSENGIEREFRLEKVDIKAMCLCALGSTTMLQKDLYLDSVTINYGTVN